MADLALVLVVFALSVAVQEISVPDDALATLDCRQAVQDERDKERKDSATRLGTRFCHIPFEGPRCEDPNMGPYLKSSAVSEEPGFASSKGALIRRIRPKGCQLPEEARLQRCWTGQEVARPSYGAPVTVSSTNFQVQEFVGVLMSASAGTLSIYVASGGTSTKAVVLGAPGVPLGREAAHA